MNDEMMINSEAISKLPLEIQTVLKRKSSRDPASRFTSKLYMLLNYVAANPHMEPEIGVAWMDDNEFRMNKRVLINIMGIKLNTLNVNLRDLHFKQLQHNKDGLTRWYKPGFARNGIQIDDTTSSFQNPPKQKKKPPAPPASFISNQIPFALGGCNQSIISQFFNTTRMIWSELNPTHPMCDRTNSTDFLKNAASRFKQEDQPYENALEVLTAIMMPVQSYEITYLRFAQFMAMFGPERSIMLKIASLLTGSNNSGRWLTFDTTQITGSQIYGHFLDNEPNKLIVNNCSVITELWNMPHIDADQSYVMDKTGSLYANWEDYFIKKPIMMYNSFTDLTSTFV